MSGHTASLSQAAVPSIPKVTTTSASTPRRACWRPLHTVRAAGVVTVIWSWSGAGGLRGTSHGLASPPPHAQGTG